MAVDPNTSATGGYLQPYPSPAPLQGQSFEDFVQQVFVGIAGLDPTLVRPRWQEEGINLPPSGTNWMAFGATNYAPDVFAVTDGPQIEGYAEFGYWVPGYAVQDPTDPSVNSFQRHEIVTFLCSFYGPECSKYMALLRDGLQVPQNLAVMSANSMTLMEATTGTRVPSLVKEKWLDRIDLSVLIRRLVLRQYPILSLLSAEAVLNNEIAVESINVSN
jgi:hypothetical protein